MVEAANDDKYNAEWKRDQMKRFGGWAQDYRASNGDKEWKWHYIKNGTEYSTGRYFTKKDAEMDNKK